MDQIVCFQALPLRAVVEEAAALVVLVELVALEVVVAATEWALVDQEL
jgi:hypothetical protein